MKNIRMHRWLWLLALPMAALAAITDDYIRHAVQYVKGGGQA